MHENIVLILNRFLRRIILKWQWDLETMLRFVFYRVTLSALLAFRLADLNPSRFIHTVVLIAFYLEALQRIEYIVILNGL